MTSLEHSESASDYDPDHWDMSAWGEIDSSAGTGASAKSPASSGSAAAAAPLNTLCEDDWDNGEWGTLQEQPSAEAELVSPSETWNSSAWTEPAVNNANATYVRPALQHKEHRLAAQQNSNDSLGGWEDGEFEPIEENADENNASKMDEMRRKREERKLQRQREMEARRSARGQGPMKLATKLTAPPPPF